MFTLLEKYPNMLKHTHTQLPHRYAHLILKNNILRLKYAHLMKSIILNSKKVYKAF